VSITTNKYKNTLFLLLLLLLFLMNIANYTSKYYQNCT